MEQRPKFCPRPCHASSGNGDELVGHTPIDSSTLEGKKGRCVFLGGVWGGGGGERGSPSVPTASGCVSKLFFLQRN